MTASCTTPSRTGTTIEPAPAKPKRRKVAHLFWVCNMEAAEAMGVQCRTLCGHWEQLHREARDKPRHVLETVGGLVPLPEPEDCKDCLRSFVATRGRQYDGMNR